MKTEFQHPSCGLRYPKEKELRAKFSKILCEFGVGKATSKILLFGVKTEEISKHLCSFPFSLAFTVLPQISGTLCLEGSLIHLMFMIFLNLIFDVVVTFNHILEKQSRVKIPEGPWIQDLIRDLWNPLGACFWRMTSSYCQLLEFLL